MLLMLLLLKLLKKLQDAGGRGPNLRRQQAVFGGGSSPERSAGQSTREESQAPVAQAVAAPAKIVRRARRGRRRQLRRVERASPPSATAPSISHRPAPLPSSRADSRPRPMAMSRAPKPRVIVRAPAVSASRPTHVRPVHFGARNMLAPTAIRAVPRKRARSRSSIAGLLLHGREAVPEAGRRGPQRRFGVDPELAGAGHHTEEQLAHGVGVGGVARGRDVEAGRRRLALHLVGVEERRQGARDAVHHAGPALLGLLDLLPVAHDLAGGVGLGGPE